MDNKVLETQIKQGRIADVGKSPKAILIDTISYCNLRCYMCVHKEMTRNKGIMSWDLYRKIIDEIAEINKNIRVWMVFFGEALMLKKRKPTIFDMIAYAKDKCLTDVVLNSNGNLMDEDASKKLIKSRLDAIYFGIDAYSKKTYEKIRIGGDYRKVINNILILLKLKDVMKTKKPEVFVQFVEMDINREEKEDFIKFWTKQGVTVKIRPKVSWAGSVDAPNQILGNEHRWSCHWAMQTMSIADDGRVVLCPVDLDARVVVGDINRQSLKEVWNGRLKELRQMHINGKFNLLPPMCRDCRDWQSARADYFSVNS